MNEITETRHQGSGLRLLLATTSRRWWTGVTLALGAAFAVLLVVGTTPQERTFALVNGPVILGMSITLPFVGVLLAADVRQGRAAVGAAVWAALALAAGSAMFGVALSAVSVAVAGSTAPGGTWRHAPQIALGSVLVAVVCQGSGLGFGTMIRRPWLACLATFSPLPVWGLLTATGLRQLPEWMTPGANAQALLEGAEPVAWLREAVVVGVWGSGLYLVYRALQRPAERVEEVQ
jgi:hypothetical protein